MFGSPREFLGELQGELQGPFPSENRTGWPCQAGLTPKAGSTHYSPFPLSMQLPETSPAMVVSHPSPNPRTSPFLDSLWGEMSFLKGRPASCSPIKLPQSGVLLQLGPHSWQLISRQPYHSFICRSPASAQTCLMRGSGRVKQSLSQGEPLLPPHIQSFQSVPQKRCSL